MWYMSEQYLYQSLYHRPTRIHVGKFLWLLYCVVHMSWLKAQRRSNNCTHGVQWYHRLNGKQIYAPIYSLLDDSFVCQRAQSMRLTCARSCIVETVEYRNMFCIRAHEAETSLKMIDVVRRSKV